jgi:alanine racemase
LNKHSDHREEPIEAKPPVCEPGAFLTIDLDALAANWTFLRERVSGTECAAVVKADGYGIGLEPAARALARSGCRAFFVAHLSEAARVRQTCPEATIYVLNGMPPDTAPTYAALRLRPVLGERAEIEEWAAFCRTAGSKLPAAVHVDTGMNRLGLRTDDALTLKGDAVLSAFDPALLMSHFVSSEVPTDPLNARQIEAFRAVRAAFPDVPASLCNSSGIFLPEQPFFDLVRPGYALYGGNPTPTGKNPMRPVVRLEARVIQVRDVRQGESVGYNGLWRAQRQRRLATLSIGYADGYPRGASATDATTEARLPSGEAIIAGRRCPFAGRVSMDLISIDVTAVPDGAVARGDLATLIGDDLTIDEVGTRAGTIGYEVLTSLGRRYARTYLGGGA